MTPPKPKPDPWHELEKPLGLPQSQPTKPPPPPPPPTKEWSNGG